MCPLPRDHRVCTRFYRAYVCLLAVLLAGACKSDEPAERSPDKSAEEEKSTETDPGTLRIAAMAPVAAEMLASLGVLDRVVAVGDFVTWPPPVADLPRLGAYNAINAELILDLRVNLVATTHSVAASQSLARLRELGVRVLALDNSTYEGTLAALLQLGRVVGKEAEARALALSIRGRMDEVARRTAGAPRPRVLFVVGRDPLYVAGPGSHIDEMIAVAGGENIAHDASSAYQLVSLEAMLERMPEIIIDTSDNRPDALRGRVNGPWDQWPFLPAVAKERVFWVDPVRLSIPGPRLPEMAELLGRLIHPEIFGEPTPEMLGPLGPTITPATTPATESP